MPAPYAAPIAQGVATFMEGLANPQVQDPAKALSPTQQFQLDKNTYIGGGQRESDSSVFQKILDNPGLLKNPDGSLNTKNYGLVLDASERLELYAGYNREEMNFRMKQAAARAGVAITIDDIKAEGTAVQADQIFRNLQALQTPSGEFTPGSEGMAIQLASQLEQFGYKDSPYLRHVYDTVREMNANKLVDDPAKFDSFTDPETGEKGYGAAINWARRQDPASLSAQDMMAYESITGYLQKTNPAMAQDVMGTLKRQDKEADPYASISPDDIQDTVIRAQAGDPRARAALGPVWKSEGFNNLQEYLGFMSAPAMSNDLDAINRAMAAWTEESVSNLEVKPFEVYLQEKNPQLMRRASINPTLSAHVSSVAKNSQQLQATVAAKRENNKVIRDRGLTAFFDDNGKFVDPKVRVGEKEVPLTFAMSLYFSNGITDERQKRDFVAAVNSSDGNRRRFSQYAKEVFKMEDSEIQQLLIGSDPDIVLKRSMYDEYLLEGLSLLTKFAYQQDMATSELYNTTMNNLIAQLKLARER